MKNPKGTVIWVEHGEWEVNVGGNETDIGGDNISQSWWHETLRLGKGNQQRVWEQPQPVRCRQTCCPSAIWFKHGVCLETYFLGLFPRVKVMTKKKKKIIFFSMLPSSRRSKRIAVLIKSIRFCQQFCILSSGMCQRLLRCTVCCTGVVGMLKTVRLPCM